MGRLMRPYAKDLQGPIYYSSYASPQGTLYAAMEGPALLAILFCEGRENFEQKLTEKFGASISLKSNRAPFSTFFRELDSYFDGRAVAFHLSVKFYGTAFQQRVWKAIAGIPRGQVRTYAYIAENAGRPRACRAAAGASAANMLPLIIPCHRVISSSGGLGGWSGGGGSKVKEGLLALEGVRLKDLKGLLRACKER
ncbi:MAG: methylated-DNA--[protein]-cysteine S-methyltransferase [Thermodesulfobacteriota bacterium]